MSVVAEFVGGPLDGEVRLLPEAVSTYNVPALPYARLTALLLTSPDRATIAHDTLRYQRSLRRLANSPTGEPVYRYVMAS
jgi:hypothetical protein